MERETQRGGGARRAAGVTATAAFLLVMAALLFSLAFHWQTENRKTALLCGVETAPEPVVCALCGSGNTYHAPVIVALATGEVLEMQRHIHLRLGASTSSGITPYPFSGMETEAKRPCFPKGIYETQGRT